MSFVPVAIVGRACLLPGARSPAELADLVFSGRDALTSVPEGRWGVSRARVMGDTKDTSGDRTWCDRGGYVHAPDLDASGYGLPEADVRALDPLFRWVLHVAREALADAGPRIDRARRASRRPRTSPGSPRTRARSRGSCTGTAPSPSGTTRRRGRT